jgi:opacity protein-like surface antigen
LWQLGTAGHSADTSANDKRREVKMKRSIKLVVAVLAVAVLALALLGCTALKDAEQLQEYDLGTDKVPSLTSVVGMRTVTAVNVGTGTNGEYKEYSYQTDSMVEDLQKYVLDDLLKNGWTATVDFNFYDMPGNAQIASKSADDGKILLMDIEYASDSYTIKITKGEGTLTFY